MNRDARLRVLIDDAGIGGRRLRDVVALLTDGPIELAELVRATAVPRRTVEAIIAALGDDVERLDGGRMRVARLAIPAYRRLIDYGRLRLRSLPDPLDVAVAQRADLVATVEGWIAVLPRARQALDHVSATAETAVRRALWLDATFDLHGARLLCVGDHDLTSLAVAAINPAVEITVVDVDDRVLDVIDTEARRSVVDASRITCLWTDLRFGLADGARGWSDLVFTDPPYTPDGVALFLARGLEGLRDRANARLVLCYGFATGQPGLGLKVQRAIGDMRLAYEAILPSFNRYHGAQAIGSASDLYVLRPTSHSPAERRTSGVNIYTHGTQSIEGSSPAPEIMAALRAAAAPDDRTRGEITDRGGDQTGQATAGYEAGSGPADEDAPAIGSEALARLLRGERTGWRRPVAIDLSADPGGWLVRALLALDAPRAAILVPNAHPDLVDAAAQHALTDLLAAKWQLTLWRSTPGPRWAIVGARRVDPGTLDAAGRVTREVLDRAHGKLGNTWREALIRESRAKPGRWTPADGALTKRGAAALIDEAIGGRAEEQLIALPRHRLDELTRRIAATATALGDLRGRHGII